MNKIKELRIENGLLQKDIEKKLNLGRGSISRFENELIALTPDIIDKLCDLFGCTADYLLCRSDTPRAALSPEDAALIEAFHAAGGKEQSIVRALLDLDSAEIKEKLHA